MISINKKLRLDLKVIQIVCLRPNVRLGLPNVRQFSTPKVLSLRHECSTTRHMLLFTRHLCVRETAKRSNKDHQMFDQGPPDVRGIFGLFDVEAFPFF
jgi:hypothetical protein